MNCVRMDRRLCDEQVAMIASGSFSLTGEVKGF